MPNNFYQIFENSGIERADEGAQNQFMDQLPRGRRIQGFTAVVEETDLFYCQGITKRTVGEEPLFMKGKFKELLHLVVIKKIADKGPGSDDPQVLQVIVPLCYSLLPIRNHFIKRIADLFHHPRFGFDAMDKIQLKNMALFRARRISEEKHAYEMKLVGFTMVKEDSHCFPVKGDLTSQMLQTGEYKRDPERYTASEAASASFNREGLEMQRLPITL